MIYLSRRAHESVPFRGEFEHHMIGYYNKYIHRITEYHFLSVHNMTHIEAPISRFFENQIQQNAFDSPVIADAIVIKIDFKDICNIVLEDAFDGKYLKKGIETSEYFDVINRLGITKQQIKEKIKTLLGKKRLKTSDTEGKFLLVSTGWQSEFYPKVEKEIQYNLDNPFFECFHPYFIHPYLSSQNDIANFLFEELKLAGFSLESASVDNPLSYVMPNRCFPSVAKLHRFATKMGMDIEKSVVSRSINEKIILRLKKDKEKFYYLKDINFKKLYNIDMGKLLVFPFKLIEDDWGIACETFFASDEEDSLYYTKIADQVDKFNDISRTSYEISPLRGFMKPEKLSILGGDVHRGYAPTIHFVPSHSTTHIDTYFKQNNISRFSQPIYLDAIVVDISFKIDLINELLASTDLAFGDQVPILKKGIVEDPQKLLEILDSLKIKKNDIETFLKTHDSMGKFIIFHTGWDIFQPTRSNLNNRFWELHHAYLTHPYLTIEAASYLSAEKKIRGIGTDAPVLENPLVYADLNMGLKNKKFKNSDAIQEVLKDEDHKKYVKGIINTGDLPCRKLFYEQNSDFIYLKNLRGINFNVINKEEMKNNTIECKILIVPLVSILPNNENDMECVLSKENNPIFGLPTQIYYYIEEV